MKASRFPLSKVQVTSIFFTLVHIKLLNDRALSR
jgi:hypothetical protein